MLFLYFFQWRSSNFLFGFPANLIIELFLISWKFSQIPHSWVTYVWKLPPKKSKLQRRGCSFFAFCEKVCFKKYFNNSTTKQSSRSRIQWIPVLRNYRSVSRIKNQKWGLMWRWNFNYFPTFYTFCFSYSQKLFNRFSLKMKSIFFG